jgi:Pyruvate phosphate dikinase, AMP/ATP-binding domain
MDFLPNSSERLLSLILTLGQYPILAPRIRTRMREELFRRGIIDAQTLETQVRDEAIQTQRVEGVENPLVQEPKEIWETRLVAVRNQLTDLLFSRHLSFELLEGLIGEVMEERGMPAMDLHLAINPELAPLDLVFEQALTIEQMPEEERSNYEARLEESRVVLIRTMISDQLRFINIAKEWFTISDLADIRRRKIGAGRIGGKAAGMLLAQHILLNNSELNTLPCISTPESYFIASDEMYTFMAINNLFRWNDQKYKTEDEMRNQYPAIVEDFKRGAFAPDIMDQLQTLLIKIGNKPLIVRSSSLLEDSFGTSFAGKYESIFCPNQLTLKENLYALTQAIAQIYASVLNPNALLYRRTKGLLDYDERMALLIQVVEGQQYGKYLMPHGAGVAFSRNLYRWAPQLRAEDGFVRLVWGLGTRAVDRVGNDYPRLIALSHPLLRPSNDPKSIRRYSQQFIDLIDLEDNSFKTLPVHDILDADYPPLRYVAQEEEEGDFLSIRSTVIKDPTRLVLTFDELIRRTPFAERMRIILHSLENAYHSPVDLEFTLQVETDPAGKADLFITLLQCRPQSHLSETSVEPIPASLKESDILFSTDFMVPQGTIQSVEYVIYVSPGEYFKLATANERTELAREIGRLNNALAEKKFICVGPGRWGSSNSDLGVPIAYGDIYKSLALVELAGEGWGLPPEPSLGTHFFQDLLESQIYPLALYMDDPRTILNDAFFDRTPNHTSEWIKTNPAFQNCLRLIRVEDFAPESKMKIIMRSDLSRAVAFLTPKDK